MSKKYHIIVTQEHIDKGVTGNTRACPIALAASAVPGVSTVRVNLHTIKINREEANLPEEATRWIERFDSYLSVQPFELDVEVPE